MKRAEKRVFLIVCFLAVILLSRLLFLNSKVFSQAHLIYTRMIPIKNVYVSSSKDESLSGQFAVDNNLYTRWCSGYDLDQQWLVVDFGKERYIKYIVLCWEDAAASHYSIEVSMDKENWRPIYNEILGKPGVTVIPMATHKKAHYMRVFCTRRVSDLGYSLFEFQVFGN